MGPLSSGGLLSPFWCGCAVAVAEDVLVTAVFWPAVLFRAEVLTLDAVFLIWASLFLDQGSSSRLKSSLKREQK
jgi:hypothetical protein